MHYLKSFFSKHRIVSIAAVAIAFFLFAISLGSLGEKEYPTTEPVPKEPVANVMNASVEQEAPDVLELLANLRGDLVRFDEIWKDNWKLAWDNYTNTSDSIYFMSTLMYNGLTEYNQFVTDLESYDVSNYDATTQGKLKEIINDLAYASLYRGKAMNEVAQEFANFPSINMISLQSAVEEHVALADKYLLNAVFGIETLSALHED